jgi:hypothetical protein
MDNMTIQTKSYTQQESTTNCLRAKGRAHRLPSNVFVDPCVT